MWRIPSYTEWSQIESETDWGDWSGPWNSPLKLHSAGGLMYDNGDILFARGEDGHYWSTLQFSYTYGRHLSFTSGFCDMNFNPKSWGFSVRCISD